MPDLLEVVAEREIQKLPLGCHVLAREGSLRDVEGGVELGAMRIEAPPAP